MDQIDYVAALRKQWRGAVGVAVAVFTVVAAYTFTDTPLYTATSETFFAVDSGRTITDIAVGSNFTEQQVDAYARIATKPAVLGPAVDDLNADGYAFTVTDLAGMVEVNVPAGTIIAVSATHPDPDTAADVSNVVSARLADVVATLTPQQEDGSNTVQSTVVAAAVPPAGPSSPNWLLNLAMGFVLATAGGAVFAFVRERFDTSIREQCDIRDVTKLPVVAAITDAGKDEPGADEDRLYTVTHPRGPRAEAIRRLRTNLQFTTLDGKDSTFLITSSLPGEGKTTTALNLAVTLANADRSVLLIDADLRKPRVAEYAGVDGEVGLSNVLVGHVDVRDVTQQWGDSSLMILPSGPVPPNPSEVLGSKAMLNLLEAAGQHFDVVIVDGPPLLPVTDAALLSKSVSGTVVVAGAGTVRKPQLRAALSTIEQVGGHVVGVVLNRVSAKSQAGSYGSYGYGTYGDEPAVRAPRSRDGGRRLARLSAPSGLNMTVPSWEDIVGTGSAVPVAQAGPGHSR